MTTSKKIRQNRHIDYGVTKIVTKTYLAVGVLKIVGITALCMGNIAMLLILL